MAGFFRRRQRSCLSGIIALSALVVLYHAFESAFVGLPWPQPQPATKQTTRYESSKPWEARDTTTSNVEAKLEEHMSIPEILNRYGLPALVFHFVVWVSTLASLYFLFCFNTSLLQMLPEECSAGACFPFLPRTTPLQFYIKGPRPRKEHARKSCG
ncbi:unnamed protein product [Symbiodinium sp. CCMP2456]|nr:unnamed protein product [Symbiodinium sp. CCMP2456]